MTDFGYFSQKIGGAIDRLLCETLERRPRSLPSGRYVSLCFDDFPKSAATNAAPMIEARGWRATWYVAGGFCGETENLYGPMFETSDLAQLASNGHDFGCHTFDHVDCRTVDAAEIADQSTRNMDFLRRQGITDVPSFAYPFGAVNLSSKKTPALSEFALRGVKPGLNRGAVDLNMMRACGLQDDNGGLARALQDLDALQRTDGWLIIFTHDVRDTPSPWGVTPEDYARLLSAIAESGSEVVTVGDMVKRMEAMADPSAVAA